MSSNNLVFEWDENKRQTTIFVRGIDFVDAALIWDDPFRQERVDNREDYGEVRYQTIGRGPLGILFVVYTERDNDGDCVVNRIISARMAKRKEIAQYESRSFKFGVAS